MDNKKPYTHTVEYAQKNGVIELYWESRELERQCAKAIDEAVTDNNYELYHYDLAAAAKTVVDQFGFDRVNFVLATIISQHEYDGRYSTSNKSWAQNLETPNEKYSDFIINTHLAILNGFIDKVRKLHTEMLADHEKYGGNDTPSYTPEIKMMEPQADHDKTLIRECINGLGLYAAQQRRDNTFSPKPEEMRKLIEKLVGYWSLDDGEHASSLADFLEAFNERVHSGKSDADITAYHRETIYGLHRYGEELVITQGNSAMSEILDIGDLIKDIASCWNFEPYAVALDMAEKLRAEVGSMLNDVTLPGQPVSGEKNVGYEILQAILFNNDRGFVLAHNPNAPAPYVTWTFTDRDGKRSYDVGSYHGSEERAKLSYISRVTNYMKSYRVTEKPIPTAAADTKECVVETAKQYPALTKLNNMLVEIVDYIAGQEGERPVADLMEVENQFGIDLMRNGTLLRTVLGMLETRPEITDFEIDKNELILYKTPKEELNNSPAKGIDKRGANDKPSVLAQIKAARNAPRQPRQDAPDKAKNKGGPGHER